MTTLTPLPDRLVAWHDLRPWQRRTLTHIEAHLRHPTPGTCLAVRAEAGAGKSWLARYLHTLFGEEHLGPVEVIAPWHYPTAAVVYARCHAPVREACAAAGSRGWEAAEPPRLVVIDGLPAQWPIVAEILSATEQRQTLIVVLDVAIDGAVRAMQTPTSGRIAALVGRLAATFADATAGHGWGGPRQRLARIPTIGEGLLPWHLVSHDAGHSAWGVVRASGADTLIECADCKRRFVPSSAHPPFDCETDDA